MAPRGDKNGSRGRSRNPRRTDGEDVEMEVPMDLDIAKRNAAEQQRLAAEKLRDAENQQEAAAKAQRVLAAEQRRHDLATGRGVAPASRGDNSPAPAGRSGRGGLPSFGRGRGRSTSQFGRGGNGSRSSSVSTAGKSGKGTYGGVSKDKPKAQTDILSVPSAEMREHTNASGLRFWGVVNTSRGGGNQSRFYAPTATGGAMGATTHVPDVVPVFEQVKRSSGAPGVNFTVEPMRPEQASFLKANAQNVVTSTGVPKSLERGIKVLSSRTGTSCIICRKDHPMVNCLFAPWGYIPGCTFCNTRDHTVDTCNQFVEMSLKQKFEFLVVERANRPMLQTKADGPTWDWYVREYLKEAGNDAAPDAIPWTSQHAKSVTKRPDFKELQAHFDERGDHLDLPDDPAHGSPEAIAQLYMGNHIFPDRAKDLRNAKDGQFPAASGNSRLANALSIINRAPPSHDVNMDQEQPAEDETAYSADELQK